MQWKTTAFDERDLRELRCVVEFVAGVSQLGKDLFDRQIEGTNLESLAAPAQSVAWGFLEKIERRFKEAEEITPSPRSDSSSIMADDTLTPTESEEASAKFIELIASDRHAHKRAIHNTLEGLELLRLNDAEAGGVA